MTRKISAYGRKLAARRALAEKEATEAGLRELITRDLRGLQIDAGIHAWMGNDGSNLVNLAGRLLYISCFAAHRAGFDADHPDMRILRGMSCALADLAENVGAIELHRAALQSGLAAIDRLLPYCDDMALLQGAAELDGMLASARGMGTADVRRAMGVV